MEAMAEHTVPASIEMAWGVRDRPAKGPKRALSLEQIVAAAITVARTEGIGAVSMSRVAGELGTSAMSLYRYVSAKQELLDLMIDAALGPPPPRPDGDWRAAMTDWAWRYMLTHREHAWIVGIPLTAPPITPNQIRWLEYGLTVLSETGMHIGEQVAVILLLGGHVRNEARMAVEIQDDGSFASYWQVIGTLIDERDFPTLSANIEGIIAMDQEQADDPDEQFVFGLERLLDGVEVLIKDRR